jgi:cell division transport system permease protein
MQLRYTFTELGQGLRRNLSMHVAVVLTLFVSLTMVGMGLLLNAQRVATTEAIGSQLEITVWLCRTNDDNPSCSSEASAAQKDNILKVVEENPEVGSFRTESKDVAFEKVKEQQGPDLFEGPNPILTADDMPESVWVTLKDPKQFKGVTSAVVGLDGVSKITDQRELVSRIFKVLDVMKWSSLGVAAALIVTALLLVGNTIRLAAMARRREIGIMRLVGASNLYIVAPFLLEALVTAAIGAALTAGSLAAFEHFGVVKGVAEQIKFLRWVGWADYRGAVLWTSVLAPVLTVVPTLVLTRKYLRV